ncbi:hypothetical protein Tco_1429312 [Tanacetum coccineum]
MFIEQSHDEVYGCLKGGSGNSGEKRLAISMVEEAWLSEKKEEMAVDIRIDDLDETINEEAQELLANEKLDSFLSRELEKSINQSDLECCKSTSSDEKNGADS